MLALVNTPGGNTPVELREVAEPQPAPNEALVEVRAFSLNRGELRLFQIRPEGWRPGQDISGVVLKQAADGSGPAAGTRVVALTDNAGWAERAAVPAHRMAALPDNASFEEAAALPVAGLTALRSLRHGAPLLGKRVLITGAAGGVGHMAVQIAARSGARVTAIVGGPERGRHLRGAVEIVEGIDRAQRPVCADPRVRRRGFARRRNRPHRGERDDRDLRQFVWRADLGQLSRLRRASECPHSEFFLFHLRGGGSVRAPIWHCWPHSSATVRSNRHLSNTVGVT